MKALRKPHHYFKIVFGKHGGHQPHFFQAHAVFAGNGPAKLQAARHDFLSGLAAVFRLLGITAIKQDQRMKVAVARMKHVADNQPIMFADAFDLSQRVRDFRPRDYAILRVIRR